MSLEPIAIVGTGCRFPGSSSSPARLWNLLRNPQNVASKVPNGRFNVDAFYHPDSQHHGATNVAESYFLDEDIRAFDAAFFNISPAEAAALDPQQRLLLETVYDSLEAGGHRLDLLQGSSTGVYCGFLRTDYSQIQFADPDSLPPYTVTGNSPAIMANRISYFFNWTGPSFSVDTGCSSSLLAVHLAVEALRKGDCAMAVAVGSNLILSPNPYIADAKTGMLSATGRSQMWDASADGYARGEGVASVVLKRLSDAIAAGDEIECIIRATGVNSDGRTTGITMPNGEAQQRLIESTYASVGLDPKEHHQRCQYFEAHGTGTQAGDPQEASAIYGAFFGDAALDDPGFLHVGSIKTVVGHTEATAGLAGLIKASLCLQHGEIAPNLLLSSPNPRILPYLSRLRVPDQCVPWPSLPSGIPRRASVNSFGFGGANVHAILESYDLPSSLYRQKDNGVSSSLLPFPVSAASPLSLRMALESLSQFLDDHPETNLMDLAFTLLTRRSCHKYRVVFTATSGADLKDQISQELVRQSRGQISANPRRHGKSQRNTHILGVFTGQGAQWPQMGLDIIRSSPQAQLSMADMQQALDSLPLEYRPDFDLMAELAAPDSESRIHEASISQPLRTAVQIIQTNFLHSLGLEFETVIGHSSGEIAAAYAAGMLDLTGSIQVAYLRGWSIQQAQKQQSPGSMIAVMMNWSQAEAICNLPHYIGKIQIAGYNSPTSVTLSGDREPIEELSWLLSSLGQAVHRLHVDTAYHSHHMQSSAEVYRRALTDCKIQLRKSNSQVRWFSTVYPGMDLSTSLQDLESEYWVINMVKSVSFSQSVASALDSSETGYDCAIEVGPHPVLRGSVNQILKGISKPTDLPYLGLAKRAQSGIKSLAVTIGELWTVLGPGAIDIQTYLNAFSTDTSTAVVKGLPRYPFDHSQSYWVESRLSRARLYSCDPPNALLGRLLPTSGQGERRWRNYLRPEELPWMSGLGLHGRSILAPAICVAMVVEAAIAVAKISLLQVVEVYDLELYQDAPIPSDNAGLETVFAVEVDSEKPHVSGKFACQAAVQGELCRVASGRFKATYGAADAFALAARPSSVVPILNPVDISDFYSHLGALGHDRSGDFRRLSSLCCNRTAASATMTYTNSDIRVHPATIDHAFQTMFAAATSRSMDRKIGSLYRVSKIGYLAINLTVRPSASETLTIDATLLTSASSQIVGSIEIFRSNSECIISGEGLHLERTATHPKTPTLFSTPDWFPLKPSASAEGNVLCRPGAVGTLMRREQLALLYLRALSKEHARKDRKRLSSEQAAFLTWSDHVLANVKRGVNPVCRPEWLEERMETICITPGLGFLAKMGEEWRRLLDPNCETDAAPAIDLVDQYYAADLQEFAPWYDRVASLIGQLTTLYPDMDLLEVTSSAGDRVAKCVLSKIGTDYKSFRRAVIDQDLEDEAVEPESVDLVLVHQALYSTKSIAKTLTTLRRLLKPGGYLILLEDTNPTLIHRKLLFPLRAWRESEKEHPAHGFVRTRETWKDLLVSHGFSGIDSITPVHDEVMSGLSIILCQAVGPTFQPLRDEFVPSNEHPELVIVASRSTWMDRTWLAVHECFRRLVLVRHITEVESARQSLTPVVVVILDPSEPDPCSGPELRRLFGSSKLLLVTSRSDVSNAATAGLLGGLSVEHPKTIFQHLELPSYSPSQENVRMVAKLLMGLVHTDVAGRSGMIESRLRLSNKGILHVPRFRYADHMNQRRLAAYIQVEDDVVLNRERQCCILQVKHGGSGEKQIARLHAYPSIPHLPDMPPATVEVDLHCATAHGIRIGGAGFFHLAIGIAPRHPLTGRKSFCRVLALSERNATRVSTPLPWCLEVPYALSAGQEAGFLAMTVGTLIAKEILSQTQPGSVVLVLEPDATSLQILTALAPLHKAEILAITHKASLKAKKTGVTHIPERTPAHRLNEMLPIARIGVVVCHINDDNWQKRIRSLVPSARHFDIGSFYQAETVAHSRAHVPVSSISAALESVSGWYGSKDVTFPVCSVAQLLSRKVDIGPTTVVDWLADDSVPVRARIHPATDGVSLPHQSSYVLWGLPGLLRRVVAEWLVSQGARHIVLVEPLSKVDRWVSTMASRGAQVTTLPPKDSVAHTVLALRGHPSLPPIQGIVFSSDIDTSGTCDMTSVNPIERAKALSQLYDSPTLDIFLGVGRYPAKPDPHHYAVIEYLSALAHQRATRGLRASVLCLGPGSDYDALDEDDMAEILAEAVLAGDPVGSQARVVTAGLCPDPCSPVYKDWEPSFSRNPAMSSMLALASKKRQESLVVQAETEEVPLRLQLERARGTASAVMSVRAIVREHFIRYLQARLQSAVEIADDTLFNELGVDSIVAAQLVGWFSKEAGVVISVVSILAGSSVGRVIQEATKEILAK